MKSAFLSYARKDENFVINLAQDLEKAGIQAWRDKRDIAKAAYWDVAVQNAIETCDCLLVILSPDAVASPNVSDEYAWALKRKKPIFPVIYRKCDIPFRLNRIERVDFLKSDYPNALAELCAALKGVDVAVSVQTPPPEAAFNEADISGAAQAIAWECIRIQYWPAAISMDAAVEAIRSEDLFRRGRLAAKLTPQSADSSADPVLKPMTVERARQLRDRLSDLGFVRRSDDGSIEVAKSSNALKTGAYGEVDRHGSERGFWENLISSTRQKLKEAKSEEIRGRLVDFVTAMQNAGKARADDLKISRSLLAELDEVAGRKSDTLVYQYFVSFVRRWGIPEGIGALEESEANHRSSVRITKRGGRVIRLESVNGSGALVPRLAAVAYLGSGDTPAQNVECRWEFSYDASGNVVLEEASDAAGRLLYRCAYSPAPPAAEAIPGQRQTTARYFLDVSDVVHPRTRSGAAFVKITRDAQGFDQRWEYLDGLGRAQPDELWQFGKQAENGPLGLPVRLTSLGWDLSPSACRSGYAIVNTVYDDKGQIAVESYFDATGQPVLHADGYHRAQFIWDDRSNWTGVRLFGLDGQPAIMKDGFSGWNSEYDQLGNQINQTHLDTQGNAVIIKSGFASWRGAYDSQGRLIDQTFYDPNGIATPNSDGVFRTLLQFDKVGTLTQVAYLDAAGVPAADYKGISRWTRRSDERGRTIEELYFGLDGRLARRKGGYAGIRISYDAKGNQVELIYLGPDGQPDWSDEGYAREATSYDSQGNAIEERYFGTGGEAVTGNDGVHFRRHLYDEHANRISTQVFDESGNPILVAGYSILTQTYNSLGNVVRKEYRDPAGSLTFHRDGYSVEENQHDFCGRVVEGRYLDSSEQLVACVQGFAQWRIQYEGRGLVAQRWNLDAQGGQIEVSWTGAYDSRSNLLRQSFFDLESRPMLSRDGIAAIHYQYDTRGNRIQEWYLGLDGKPASLVSGVAGILWKYDARGNAIEQRYINVNGLSVTHKDNYASWTATYDACGNLILRQFFGTEGQAVATHDGFVRIQTEYDDRGQPCLERKLTSKNEEYATHTKYDPRNGREERFFSPRRQIVTQFNRAGASIREAWFNLDGLPETAREDDIAFSRSESEYDSCGRVIRKRYLDSSNALVREIELGYSAAAKQVLQRTKDWRDDHWQVTEIQALEDGSSTETKLLSLDGKTGVSDPGGRSRWIEKYDNAGNRKEAVYFDADGVNIAYHGHLQTAASFDKWDRLAKVRYVIPFGGSDILQRSFAAVQDKLPRILFDATSEDGKVSTHEAFVLEYRMNPGDSLAYSTELDIGDRQLRFDMVQRCLGVSDDGSMDLAVDVSTPANTITMTMARKGKVLRTSVVDPPNQPWFPTHPVFVGEAWQQQMPFKLLNPFTNQPWIVSISFTYELLEVTKQDGIRIARIRSHIPSTVVGIGSEVKVTISAAGENTFDIDRGIMMTQNVSTHVQYVVLDEQNDTDVRVAIKLDPPAVKVNTAQTESNSAIDNAKP